MGVARPLAASRGRANRQSLWSVGLAVALLLAFAAMLLLERKERVIGASGVRPSAFVAEVPTQGGELCQQRLQIPTGTGSLEVLTGTFGQQGPQLQITISDSRTDRTLSRSVVRRGWRQGPLRFTVDASTKYSADVDAEICFRSEGGAGVAFAGESVGFPATVEGKTAAGAVSVVARSAERSSLIGSLFLLEDRLGRGNAGWIGPWTVWVIGALLTVGTALGAWSIARTPASTSLSTYPSRAFVPAQAKGLVAAATMIGLSWALLTPPFQVPDETSHVAYVQYLSQAGALPIEKPGVPPFSEEEREVLGAIGFARVIGRPLEKVLMTRKDEDYLRVTLGRELSLGGGNAATASTNPPLYYLLQAPVFLATSSGSLLTQLLAMRFASVLLMAGTVFFTFLFARELAPRSPWSWTAAGLAVTFQPVLGFIGAGVNPDGLLFLAGSALLFGIARLLRCGLTTRRACFVAGALGVGLLAKPLFFALVPAAVIGVALAALRAPTGWRRPCVLATLVVLLPVAGVATVGATVFDHPYFATATAIANSQTAAPESGGSIAKQASFMWQLFLPRLPFLNDQIPGVPVVDIWINGLVGVFGWVDYSFGAGVKIFASRVFLVLILLSSLTLVSRREVVRRQWRVAACSLLALSGVLAVVGVVDYQASEAGGARFLQARYLLPVVALYGALFALSIKAFGETVGRAMLPLLWVVVAAHTLAAISLTFDRYYL